MKKYAIISTRDENHPESLVKLQKFYVEAGFEVKIQEGFPTMLGAYKSALDEIKPNNKDIIVFSHDDIEILTNKKTFNNILEYKTLDKKSGFLGLAGACILTTNGVWWERKVWEGGCLRGVVHHGEHSGNMTTTSFGTYGEVVVLDGVFFACRGRCANSLDWSHPEYLEHGWDFYDIHITSQAFQRGFRNEVVPIQVLHHSHGLGSTIENGPWSQNRVCFTEHFKDVLPIAISELQVK